MIKFFSPVDPVVHVPSVRKVTSEKGGNLTKIFETRLNSRLSEHLEVEEKKSWKLLEPVLAGLLLVVDPHL